MIVAFPGYIRIYFFVLVTSVLLVPCSKICVLLEVRRWLEQKIKAA